jgi:DNA replication protein DnaC
MLTHPTHEALRALKLDGMAEVFTELLAREGSRQMDPVEWIGLMLDRESAARDSRRFQTRLHAANLREASACMEDVNYRAARKLDRALFQSLQDGVWITKHRSILITGPCGVGKSWLACALGHEACRQGKVTLYFRMPRLFSELATARGDGSFERLFRKIVRADVLILDDWGPEQMTASQRRDLMEIVDDRYNRKATIVTSQLPVEIWYDIIGDPTFADAILDRLVHHAHRVPLDGPSMRKNPRPGIVADTNEAAQ